MTEWINLPLELLSLIFSYVDEYEDLIAASGVCRAWSDGVNLHLRTSKAVVAREEGARLPENVKIVLLAADILQELNNMPADLTELGVFSDEVQLISSLRLVPYVENSVSLRRLSFFNIQLCRDVDELIIAACGKSVPSFRFHTRDKSWLSLETLRTLTNVRETFSELVISCSQPESKATVLYPLLFQPQACLKLSSSIQDLGIMCLGLLSGSLTVLKHLKGLKKLALYIAHGISYEELLTLSQLPIVEFQIEGCHHITPENWIYCFQHHFKSLEQLKIHRYIFNQEIVQSLTYCQRMSKLSLCLTTPEAILTLAQLPRLTSLFLKIPSNTLPIIESVYNLVRISQLQELTIVERQVPLHADITADLLIIKLANYCSFRKINFSIDFEQTQFKSYYLSPDQSDERSAVDLEPDTEFEWG